MSFATPDASSSAAAEPDAVADAKDRRPRVRTVAVWSATALAYLALTVLHLGPQPVTECGGTLYGGPGDSTAGMIWLLWNYDELDALPFEARTPLVDAPDGGELWRPIFATSLVVMLPAWGAAQIVGPVCAWNTLVIAGFVASASAMCGFVCWLTRHRGAAFVAGYAFAFTPFALRKAEGHLNYVHLWIFPMILWALLWAAQRRSWRRAALAGLVIGMAGYVDGYYLLMATVTAAALLCGLLLEIARRRAWPEVRDWLALALVATATSLVVLAPIGAILLTSSSQVSEAVTRSISDVAIYSARPWEYVLPARTHPVFSSIFGSWQDRHLHESNYSEQTLYLGVSVILLAAIGAVAVLRGRMRFRPGGDPARTRMAGLALLAVAAIGLAFSAPPRMPVVDLPTPSSLVYGIAPFWRVFARFFIPVDAAVVALAGFGLAKLAGPPSWKTARGILVCTVAAMIVAFDLLAAPPRPQWSYAEGPEVYRWLDTEPADEGIVANYPIVDPPLDAHLTYLTYQRVHERPILNGASTGSESWQLKASLIGLADPQTIPTLRRLGVTTVVVHRQYLPGLGEAKVPPELIRRFTSPFADAYDIKAGPDATAALTIGEGFHVGELEGLHSQRWMGTTAELGVRYFEPSAAVDVAFSAVSFATPRRLTVTQAGQVLWEGRISADTRTPVAFRASGQAPIILRTSPKAVEIGSVLKGTNDGRIVSINLSRLDASAR